MSEKRTRYSHKPLSLLSYCWFVYLEETMAEKYRARSGTTPKSRARVVVAGHVARNSSDGLTTMRMNVKRFFFFYYYFSTILSVTDPPNTGILYLPSYMLIGWPRPRSRLVRSYNNYNIAVRGGVWRRGYNMYIYIARLVIQLGRHRALLSRYGNNNMQTSRGISADNVRGECKRKRW